MVPPHTGALQWGTIKLFQTDGLSGKDQSLGSIASRYNPIRCFLLWLRKGPDIPFKLGSVVELRERIYNAVVSVTPQMLGNTLREIEYHLDILRPTNSAHIEVRWDDDLDELFFQAKQTNSLYLIHLVICVYLKCGE
jgi:hypothetical protein